MGVPARAPAQSTILLDDLLTRAEQTDYAETSRYDDVVRFVRSVAAASPYVRLTTFGYTTEGRALPLVVVGQVTDASAGAIRASGRTRVFILANIHGGEVCGKEAVQMLLRDVARGQHRAWLDSLVVLIAPIYNADGNERVLLTNRPAQHGPVGGMGQRPNAQGYDLNRDHMKLDSPEARSLARLLNEYDPHAVIDLHTTNGTRHGYHITYSPPLHPNTDERLDRFLRDEWLPAAQRHLRETQGWASFYYGNAGRPRDGLRQWRTFDHRPRFNNNYVGLRNRLAILSEAYAYATFRERVVATLRFVEGVLDFAVVHAARIRRLTDEVDVTDLRGRRLAVRAAPASSGPIEILMGEVDEERHPYSGAIMLRRRDTVHVETMEDYGTFAPSESERVPEVYYVPDDLDAVLQKLREHGIVLRRLERDTLVRVEEFRIDSTRVADREFQGHRERTVHGAYRQVEMTVPAGWYAVTVAQPLGRLAFTLLEPRSDDGLANWNVLDPVLDDGRVYPIRRR